MKCGDVVRNHYASEDNPTRIFIYIRNEGEYTRVIDMHGDKLVFDRYYSCDLKNKPEKFEVIDHIPIEQMIKDMLKKHLDTESEEPKC